MHEDDALELGRDVRQLGGVGLEELASRRDIIEKVLDEEVGAYGTRHRLLRHHTRPLEDNAGAQFLLGSTRLQFHLRDSGYGGKCLAAESHRGEGEEVCGLTDLARSMTLKSQAGIGLTHSTAVVDDLEAGASGIDGNDINAMGTGIYGVLHQFLDQRGRTLDDFACSYLVGDAIGKELYEVHWGTNSARRYKFKV